MQEKEIKLLFDEGAITKCVVVEDIGGSGYNALFIRRGEKSASISLETKIRAAGGIAKIRVFKTIDSACSLVKRQVGFNEFIVKKT